MNKELLTRFGVVFFLALTFFLAILTVKAVKEYQYIGYDPSSENNTIVVSGEGEAFAVPDVATFSFTVRETGKTVAAAQKVATDKMNAALKVVKDGGVEEKDIRTIGYNVYPRYEYQRTSQVCPAGSYCPPEGRQVIVGYEVSQTIEVKVRDTAKAGEFLTTVGAAGISEVSGIEFTIDDEDKIQEDARAKAIADAAAKAERLAGTLGVRIGKIVGFTESGSYPPAYYRSSLKVANGMGGMDQAAEAAPLPMGENKVVSQVQITYEIR